MRQLTVSSTAYPQRTYIDKSEIVEMRENPSTMSCVARTADNRVWIRDEVFNWEEANLLSLALRNQMAELKIAAGMLKR